MHPAGAAAEPARPPRGTPSPPWLARLAARLSSRAAPDAIDYAVAVGCFACFTLPLLLGLTSRIGSPLAVASFGVLAATPLIVRRRWPIAALAAVTVVLVVATFAGVRFTPFVSNAGPNFAIAVFTVADRCPRRSALAAASIAAVATWVVLPLGILLHPGQDQDAVQLLAALPAWVAGDIVRVRRRYRQRLELETRRRAAEQDRRIRAEERLRLSRDVHDVVSHSLSMIAVRSGVARMLLDEQPAEARVALATIETASRSALDDLRQLLRRIRDPGAQEDTALATLGDLPGLVGRLRDSGLDVSLQRAGEPRAYSTAVEMSAYRIAQEALTNVVKHAAGARTSVTVSHGQAELTIAVTNEGPVPPPHQQPKQPHRQPKQPHQQPKQPHQQPKQPHQQRKQPQPQPQEEQQQQPAADTASPGLGIVGMRERVAMLDGQFTAGPRPEGGFAVVARLPVQDHRQ
jgi:signal transduction histidine kinase